MNSLSFISILLLLFNFFCRSYSRASRFVSKPLFLRFFFSPLAFVSNHWAVHFFVSFSLYAIMTFLSLICYQFIAKHLSCPERSWNSPRHCHITLTIQFLVHRLNKLV